MSVNIDAVRNALALFHVDPEFGAVIRCNFIEFAQKVQNASYSIPEYRVISRNLDYVKQDLGNIQILLEKIRLFNSLVNERRIDIFQWYGYVQTDVEFFFTEIRSIFNYLSLVLCNVSSIDCKSIKDHGTSFNTTYNWLNGNPDNQIKFGPELSNLILSCEWFFEIRELRDLIRHHGGQSFVSFVDGRILFQILTGSRYTRKIKNSQLMYNENLVDFQLYSALYISYLLSFLEEVSTTCELELNLLTSKNTGINWISYPFIRQWIEELLERLESPE